jgi:hypothetical protein
MHFFASRYAARHYPNFFAAKSYLVNQLNQKKNRYNYASAQSEKLRLSYVGNFKKYLFLYFTAELRELLSQKCADLFQIAHCKIGI